MEREFVLPLVEHIGTKNKEGTIGCPMTVVSKRLERIFQTVSTWSIDRQEAAADVLEQIDRLTTSTYELSEDERSDIEQAIAEARRGEFASEAEVAALFARYDR
jgi:hypothetical protein